MFPRNLPGTFWVSQGEYQRQTVVWGTRAVNYYREVSFQKTLSKVVDGQTARDSRERKHSRLA